MKSGQTFVVDAQAVQDVASHLKVDAKELDGKLSAGDSYVVAKSEKCEGDVIKASRQVLVDGELKSKKGRPRRFPRSVVARLVGETDDRSLTAPTEEAVAQAKEEADESELEAHAASLLAEAPATEEISW